MRIAAGVITLLGALSMRSSKVNGRYGCEFVYLKKFYGGFFFPLRCSLITLNQTGANSGEAYVFTSRCTALSLYLNTPVAATCTIGWIFFPFQDFGIKLTTILVILLFTFLNMTGLRGGAWLSKAILILVGAGLLVIVVFGLTSNVAKPPNFMNVKDLANGTVTLSSFYTAMLAAFWAYQGWVSVGFIGGEIKDPTRNIPKGIAAGVGMIIIIYAVVNLTYLSLLSIPQLSALTRQVTRLPVLRQ